MRTPHWEQSPGALAALLNGPAGRTARRADLYTITLAGGTILRYSAEDEPVSIDGVTWVLGPILSRSQLTMSVGLEVSSLNLKLVPRAGLRIHGIPMMAFITSGGFDGARIEHFRAYSGGPGQPWVGAISRFGGRVGDIEGGRHEKRLAVRSDTELLDCMIPADVYQPACLNTLYDTACGVDREAAQLVMASTTASDVQRHSFGIGAFAVPDGHLALGTVRFTSGANTGVSRTVRSNSAGDITVIAPWPLPVAAGDSFVALPGCNKTVEHCAAKFDNLLRYRGMPYVPAAETVT